MMHPCELLTPAQVESATHTFLHFRDELFIPQITKRRSFSAWTASGMASSLSEASRRRQDVLASCEPCPLPPSVDRDLRSFMARRI